MILKSCIKLKKTLFLIIAAVLFTTVAFGQGRTSREQTILNVFGRLNLADNLYDNLNYWTDGSAFYRPFFFDACNYEASPRANSDTIFFCGGNTHEGGWGMNVLLAADGKMTIANDDWRYKKGDRVEYRTLGGETLLLISDVRTGSAKEVLKKFDGRLYERYIDDFYRYIFAGSFRRTEGSSETVVFNRGKSVVSGLISRGETPYTFIEEFGDTPIPVLRFSDEVVYKANRTLTGMELIPILTGPDIDLEWQIEADDAKPVITLVKTAAGRSDLPPGFFPLASVQVMTLTELAMYAGVPTLRSLGEMRNEIFARHGYKFKTDEWAGYFGTKDWYWPQYDDVSSKLTEIERINITLIQLLEKEYAARIIN